MRIIGVGALLLGQLAGQILGGGAERAAVTAQAQAQAPAQTTIWGWPLSGADGGPPTVVRPFQPPERRWDAGHRGLDLVDGTDPTAPEVVRAAGPGTVTFAGQLFGRGVVSISHGSVRTTYQPVDPLVQVGQHVALGQPIGLLQPGHCPDRPCLHWGLLVGHGRHIRYYDPSILVGPGRVRLEAVRSR